MQNGITCTTLRRLEELENLQPLWRELWATDPHATPFQSPEWLVPWARQFARSDLRTVLLQDHRALLALLPFYRFLDPQTGERRCLLLGAGTSDYLDGVYSPSCSADHIGAGLRFFCCESDWDELHVLQVRNGSKLGDALLQLQFPGLRRLASEACSRFPAVPFEQLPKSVRDQARYYRRRAMKAGRLELKIAGESDWRDIFEELLRLHTARWQRSGQPGLLADGRVPAWHRETLPALLQSGLLRLFALSLDGEIIAALYSLLDPPARAQRTMYFYMTAYSVSHAELRPGTVLMAMAVDQAAREGVKIIDMLRGDEGYKRLWHPERLPTCGFSMPHLPLSSSIIGFARSDDKAA